ncbi:hypothetical protein [Streptomyces sp. NPDC060022]|uniref:hypothetical protein n=1 Tax=Streptomyces sp. NPDC060022 TaxID=3347039 RepID=UPI0036A18F02
MNSTDGDLGESSSSAEQEPKYRFSSHSGGHGQGRDLHEQEIGGLPDWVMPVITTASILPFMQALATEAGQRSYDTARERVLDLLRRKGASTPSLDFRIIVQEEFSGVTFRVPAGLPDEALAALAVTDLEELVQPEHGIAPNVIHWDAEAKKWRGINA